MKPEDFEEAKKQYYELGNEIDRLTKKRLEFEKFTTELIKSGGASLKTSKEINSAIDALKRLQSSIPIGSEYYNKIEATIQGLKGRLPKTTTDGGGGGGGGGITDNKKELTIQQQISELENQAVAATEEERVAIGEKIRALDDELARRKAIVEEMHKVPEVFPDIPVSNADISPYEQMKQGVLTKIGEQNEAVDTTTLTTLMQEAIKNGIEGFDADFSSIFEKIGDGMDIPDSTWQELTDEINAKLKELGIEPIEIDFKTGNVKKQLKEMAKDWNEAASAINAVGGALEQIEDPMAKVAGIIAQAVATVALTFAKSAAAGTATMISTIAAIKDATKGGFANGGIVPGNSFSGDNLHTADYGINSGELILSRSQQNNLASQLSGGGIGNLQLEAVVSGEQIILASNNRGLRTGRGEIVQSRRVY